VTFFKTRCSKRYRYLYVGSLVLAKQSITSLKVLFPWYSVFCFWSPIRMRIVQWRAKLRRCLFISWLKHESQTPFTRYNRLSNRVVQPVWQPAVYTIQPVVNPVVQPGLTTGWTFVYTIQPVVQTGLTTGCSGLTTGLTTGCIVYTNIQPVVNPVWQPVWQQVVSCKRGFRDSPMESGEILVDIASFAWVLVYQVGLNLGGDGPPRLFLGSKKTKLFSVAATSTPGF